MSHRDRLSDRLVRTANEVLFLAFHPEMRRIVGQVGEYRHHRSRFAVQRCICRAQTVKYGAIEVGYKRYDEIDGLMLPEARQQLRLAAVQAADEHLRRSQHRPGAKREAALKQKPVVQVLDSNSCDPPDYVHRLEQVAKIQCANSRSAPPLRQDGVERAGRRAMASASVEENQVYAGALRR